VFRLSNNVSEDVLSGYKLKTHLFLTIIFLSFLQDIEIPDNLRDKRHVHGILKLDEEFKEEEELLAKTIETTLKELKRLYDNAIKPLEITYKYRDLSNRHFAGKKNLGLAKDTHTYVT
jgi:hypothetical protein